MIKLLSILSILIYQTYSQSCANNHDQSTFFSVSIHGRSVSKIGTTEYIDIIKTAAERIIPTGGGIQRVGLQSFGGTATQGHPDVGSETVEDLALSLGSTYADIETLLTDLPTTHDFSKNYANSLSEAMASAIGQSWNGQQYHIVFAAGNPLANQGSTTKPTNADLPCANAVEAKQNNIQTYVALIGAQGIDFVKQFYSCVVEDVSTDIIVIDPTDPDTGIDLLMARVCKTNGIDFKITEINPIAPAFVEVLNRGAPVTITVGLGGATDNSGTNVLTGAYYDGNPDAAIGGSAGWTATATGGVGNDSVTHDTNNGFQSQVTSPETRSFALRAEGFNNQYGLNWRSSCGDWLGTPGTKNPIACSPTGGTCASGTCSASCGTCTVCGASNHFCTCAGGYWGDVDTCIDEPTVEATGCVGFTMPDWEGTDFTYFAFNLEYDGIVSFTTAYNVAGDQGSWANKDSPVAVASSVIASEITAGSSIIDVSTTVTSISTVSSTTIQPVTCSTTTKMPTISPSRTPSKAPTKQPSKTPTKAPTFKAPGVYLSEKNGITGCGLPRCNCVEAVRSCCTPFGPEHGLTMTTGVEPSTGCPNLFKKWEITSKDQKNGLTENIYIGKYSEGGTKASTIFYRITKLGQINATSFGNLTSWTNYYDNETTLARKRRLQSDTPAPTTEFGNKLNIEVTPPGDNIIHTGSITIPDDATSGAIPINISVATLKCKKGQDCTTYSECQETSMAFQFNVLNCTSSGTGNCAPLYPTTLWISIKRDNELCAIIFGKTGGEDELPDWFWWVLIALIIFLLILAWLVYRFWWKQKKTASELGDAEDELDQQQADNEQGFGKDLDVGDVAFNPMATGVPGMNRPADAFGNELHQRQLEQQNDMVDVQAEIFQVRHDYGQVVTEQRHQGQ